MTIEEAFQIFKSENKSFQFKKSKFHNLRPEYVLPVPQTPRNVCVCKYHANFDFLVDGIKKYSRIFQEVEIGKTLVVKMTCRLDDESCMTGHCNDCILQVGSLMPICTNVNSKHCLPKPFLKVTTS